MLTIVELAPFCLHSFFWPPLVYLTGRTIGQVIAEQDRGEFRLDEVPPGGRG